MATRFYFSYATVPPVSPAIDAGWDYTSEFSREPWASPGLGDALAQALTIGPLSGTAGHKGISGQYISEPLEAQTISGTVKGQILAAEVAGTDNINQIVIVLKVVSNDGSTVRGTCLALGSYGPTAEFSAGSAVRNKKIADGDTITSVDAEAGDRLVLEIGASNSVSGTTPEFFFKVGDNATDLPEDETQTTDGAGWFEFSDDITFQGAGADATVTPAAVATTVSLPGPTASASSTATPATIAAPTAIPQAGLSAGSTMTPAAIAAPVGIPQAALSAQSVVTPATVPLVTAMPQASAIAGGPVTPGVIALVVALPAPVASAGSTVLPGTVPLVVALPLPTAAGVSSATATPAVIALVLALPSPTITVPETWRVIVPSAAASVTSSGSGTIDPPTGSAVTGPGGGTIDPPTSPPITVP